MQRLYAALAEVIIAQVRLPHKREQLRGDATNNAEWT